MQVSGHKNVQSINNYCHVSVQHQKTMSRILSSSSTETALPVARSNSAETTEMVSSSSSKGSWLPVGLFRGAVIHGGHFNITVNTLNQSPKSSTTKRYFQTCSTYIWFKWWGQSPISLGCSMPEWFRVSHFEQLQITYFPYFWQTFSLRCNFVTKALEGENLSMNKTNKLQHGKCFCTHSLAARSFVSWKQTNSCVNTVRAHFPWSNLYIFTVVWRKTLAAFVLITLAVSCM